VMWSLILQQVLALGINFLVTIDNLNDKKIFNHSVRNPAVVLRTTDRQEGYTACRSTATIVLTFGGQPNMVNSRKLGQLNKNSIYVYHF